MGAIASSPVTLWIFGAMLAGLAGFLIYAWVTRYREDWDTLLRKWSRRPDDGDPDHRPPAG